MSRSVTQDYDKLRALPSRTQENMVAACHNCGTSGEVKAMASRGEETRYFCHSAERSCYNERRGTYFDDVNPGATALGEASAEVIDILGTLTARMSAGLTKHEERKAA